MEVAWLVLGVMLVISAAVNGVVEMSINPKRATRHRDGSVKLMCNMNNRVDHCHFNVWLIYFNGTKRSGNTINLEKGRAFGTSEWPKDKENPLFNASYHGAGLEHGQCGLRMSGLTPGLYFVGCRVRTASSGWAYDHMALLVHNSTETPETQQTENNIEVDTEFVHVNETKITRPISFGVKTKIGHCQIFLPSSDCIVTLTTNKRSNDSNSYIAYWDLPASTISVTLRDVTSGGVMWCLCKDMVTEDYTDFDLKIVTLLKPPDKPDLTVLRTNFTVGESLTATCVAKYARPVARIVWKLGDDAIRNDIVDDNADVPRMDIDSNDTSELPGKWPWRWPWSTKSIKQDLVYPLLTLEDNGKNLTCHVSHPALANGLSVSSNSTITVNPGSSMFLIIAVILGVLTVAVIIGIAIFWLRRKRAAFPAAEAVPSDRTSFIVDNDLYQSHTEARFVNAQAPGSRRSYQPENPYDELTTVPIVDDPPATPSARQSAIYGNTVQYEEVIVGPSAGSKPPPRKPVDPEACVYAEVMHKDRPKN